MAVNDDKPSIAELQRSDVQCRCGGMFSRDHNETRGCQRHGSLPSDVSARDGMFNAAPVLLEIAAAALAYREHPNQATWPALLAALAKVRS